MPALRQIDLRENQFVGAVPCGSGSFPFLNRLDLSVNRFTGVQAGLGNAPSLDDIDLSNNRLTARFSTAFTQIDDLTELDLSFN